MKWPIRAAAVAAAVIFPMTVGIAQPSSLIGEICYGAGHHPLSAWIVTHFESTNGQVVAIHSYGSKNIYKDAKEVKSGMTTDKESHPVEVDGSSLRYVSGSGYTYTYTPNGANAASVVQSKSTYYDKYTVECRPAG